MVNRIKAEMPNYVLPRSLKLIQEVDQLRYYVRGCDLRHSNHNTIAIAVIIFILLRLVARYRGACGKLCQRARELTRIRREAGRQYI